MLRLRNEDASRFLILCFTQELLKRQPLRCSSKQIRTRHLSFNSLRALETSAYLYL
jgi:hypothetical protein